MYLKIIASSNHYEFLDTYRTICFKSFAKKKSTDNETKMIKCNMNDIFYTEALLRIV